MDIEEAKKTFQALGPGDFTEAVSELLNSRDVWMHCTHGCRRGPAVVAYAVSSTDDGDPYYLCDCAVCTTAQIRADAMGLTAAIAECFPDQADHDRFTKKSLLMMSDARRAAKRKDDLGERIVAPCHRCKRVIVFIMEVEGDDLLVLHVDRDEDGVPANPTRRTQDGGGDDWVLCEKCFADNLAESR